MASARTDGHFDVRHPARFGWWHVRSFCRSAFCRRSRPFSHHARTARVDRRCLTRGGFSFRGRFLEWGSSAGLGPTGTYVRRDDGTRMASSWTENGGRSAVIVDRQDAVRNGTHRNRADWISGHVYRTRRRRRDAGVCDSAFRLSISRPIWESDRRRRGRRGARGYSGSGSTHLVCGPRQHGTRDGARI